MHKLQCQKHLGWDKVLTDEQQREWKNIARQCNSAPALKLDRSMGSRSSKYNIVVFTDVSRDICGCITYLQEVESSSLNFVSAKNRIISKSLATKSIIAQFC